MEDFYSFFIFWCLIILQRLIELRIARNNEKWMMEQGAIEYGHEHYRFIVWMHLLFFLVFISEKITLNRGISDTWQWLLFVFILTQLVRVWALFSLGKYWNTKIIVLPGANVVKRGPYRWIKHPNYLIVSIELLVIPLLFNCFLTAAVFTLLNIFMLSIRIPKEEQALKTYTEYEGAFHKCNRFLPKLLKKYDN
ncbi:isoprenylcysteine carboxyl methyltransferase family protein [Bacillus xiapuensis]|uniref:Isoprenylcysteine carboxylmethyltransferase family protein n=1 Tax=Bacillus xiapuensis TaxID=2014075 RepID=A0ABU6NBC1_9BACI|nr:isoprenylcysteine carboxylmethyltransferase family protein [Bacillus xiapuensis]